MVATQPKISLSLDVADTTIMHRVGMTGLYMTLKRLEKQYPSSRQRGGHISWVLTADTIELFWEGSDFVALSWLINESFKLDDIGLIHLAGLDNDAIDLSQKIYIHEGMCAVFLRHNQFYQAGKLVNTELTVEETKVEYQYKSLTWYAHQTFAEKLCEADTQQLRQDYIQITSWLYLGGIVRHARTQNTTKLEEKPEYALALLFVPVVCHYCLLHIPSEDLKQRKPHRYLVVIPEIKDFEEASQRRWQLQQLETKQLHVSSLGEAGLLYYSLDNIHTEGDYYQACQVWLYEKINRASRQRTLMSIEEIEIDKNTLITYQQVQKYFQPNYQKVSGGSGKEVVTFGVALLIQIGLHRLGTLLLWHYHQKIKPKQIFIKVNPIRSLIADHLVKGIHWWSNFWEKLVMDDSKEYLFNQLFFNRKGFIIMVNNSEEDKQYLIFIKVFQQSMKGNFAKMSAKAEEEKSSLIKKKVERLRAELNYCYDELSFKEYVSDFLVRGGLNKHFYEHQEEISLLIKKTPWQELRIWSLLAIASYKPKDKPTNRDDSPFPNNQKLKEVNDESEEE
ncbi:type I-MYXAN CRISPR-associated Cas8a1/Cmx1 [Nostoc commune]|uniref:type I-MYXAN CRISPR-associated Cas8a1/Cmx1 n=1 Tax=Nostoc commune TaxID=1178 RepID=UPI001E481ADB|nr:type I-MYXAN CRISPR-associated Cas8a1/Cmx1 [Nostoc commune]MBG1261444.1 type I-MYXAN CRISPR-associated Cas8a1/Cmx1 [Nostoc commune BAE]